jgi:hypothetical protein
VAILGLLLVAWFYWSSRERAAGEGALAPEREQGSRAVDEPRRVAVQATDDPERATLEPTARATVFTGKLLAVDEPELTFAGTALGLLSARLLAETQNEETAQVARTTTDDTSRFRFEVSEPGEFVVLCEVAGFRAELAPLRPDVENVVVLRRASTKTSVTGEVVDADGAPVVDYRVLLGGEGLIKGSNPNSIQPQSRFEVEFEQRPDFASLTVGVLARGSRPGHGAFVSQRGNTANVGQIVLQRSNVALSGFVVDASTGVGIANASVTPIGFVLGRDGRRRLGHENPTQTDATGAFEVTDVSGEGVALLLVVAPGYAETRFDVLTLAPDAPLRIELSSGGALEGRVVFAKPEKARNFSVRCVAADLVDGHADVSEPFEHFAQVDAEGRFRFANLADGTYEVDLVVKGSDGSRNRTSRSSVRIQSGRTEWLELSHGNGATLTIPLRGTSGLPDGALISAYVLDSSGLCVSATSVTLSRGDLRLLDVPPGSFDLEVRFGPDSRFHFRRAEHVTTTSTSLAPADLSDLIQRSRER